LTLEASPLRGPAPLLVSVSASVYPAVPSSFDWSFGDGSYWNVTQTVSSSTSHLYIAGGEYQVTVRAEQGDAIASDSVDIRVSAIPFTVVLGADPFNGPAPLTVNFTGLPTGGTGTYPSFVWTFGDGGVGSGPSVVYTFLRAGTYRVGLEVLDTDNRSAWANVSIVVGPGPGTSVSDPLLPSSGVEWAVALSGLAAIIVLLAAVLLRSRSNPLGVGLPGSLVPPGRGGDAGPPTFVEEHGPVLPIPPDGAPPRPGPLGPGESNPTPEALAPRVLLHLYGLGVLGPDDVATVDHTQAGVATRLGIRQSAASRVLRQLEAGGVVESRTRHVRGQKRRVRVYVLTASGERLARGLRLARSPGAGGRGPAAPP